MSGPAPSCPACGEPLYGWFEAETAGGRTLMQRCEACGLGLVAGTGRDEAAAAIGRELTAGASGELELRVPNRRSIQAGLGATHWAAVDPSRRPVYPTPAALEMLARHAGLEVVASRSARWGPALAWMWQTILNSFTFNDNFLRRLRRGELAGVSAARRMTFSIDLLVTILSVPLVALVALPLELAASLAGRGGELVVRVRRGAP